MALIHESNRDFAAVLRETANIYRADGFSRTADELDEAARRIAEIEFIEEAAYEAGMVDAVSEMG